jgi:predicted dehydrogenase
MLGFRRIVAKGLDMKIAVIGTGVIGRLRAATVHANKMTDLVAVADVDSNSAAEVARLWEAKAFSDYREMLQHQSLDAVIVSSPAALHEEMCIAALESDCHVLCEKPLAPSLESCRHIRRQAKLQSRIVAVGFNHRFYPAVKFLKNCIQAGDIGSLDHLRVFGGHDGLHNFRADWMYQGDLSGGGAMMDIGLHTTDLARHIAGEITEVCGSCSDRIWQIEGSEDNALAVFKTADKVPILYQATWTEWRGYQFSVEAYGDQGMVRASYAPMQNLSITREAPATRFRKKRRWYPQIMLREKLQGWQSTTLRSFKEELNDLLRMISGEKNLDLATVWDGERAVEVAKAVYRASENSAPVILTDPE